MLLPSSTACTIVEKSSSSITMAAASFATSVPVCVCEREREREREKKERGEEFKDVNEDGLVKRKWEHA